MADPAIPQREILSPELMVWVDEIADQFESAWRTLTPPVIEDFLGGVTELRRGVLLTELVKLDAAYRRRLGEKREIQDYIADFPELRGLFGFPEEPFQQESRAQAAPAAADPLAPEHRATSPAGLRVRGYEILGELGRGGMGVVYRARQVALNRIVALKMILPGGFLSPRQRARFRAEAEAAAQIQHPNIVSIYEVGEYESQPFCAMEYIPGGNLGQRLGGTPQPSRAVALLIETLGRAVQHAHDQGIVHRDLKPANVLLDRGPETPLEHCRPTIADFGLAKQVPANHDSHGLDAAVELCRQTQTGEILGTPSYMAPEQAEGNPGLIGPAADIYGLGAILYECLTGRPPFRGQTALDTLEQVRSQEPVPPTRLRPRLHRDLATICLKAMAKAPARRYATARELADDLRRYLDGRPILARPVSRPEKLWRWCRRNPLPSILSLAAILFFVVGFLVSAYFAVAENAQAREARAHAGKAELARKRAVRESALLAIERGRNLAEQADGSRGLLWLVRGLELATEADDPELTRVVRANLASVAGGLHKLRQVLPVGPLRERCIFTPDGKSLWVSSWQSQEVRLWEIDSASPGPELPWDHAQAFVLAMSPDGKLLFTGSGEQSRLWDAATGRPRDPPLQSHEGIRVAAFAPNGRVLATGSGRGSACLWDVATGQCRARLTGHQAEVMGVAFSPDGRILATGSIDDTVRFWDAETGQPKGKPISLRGQVYALAWSRDGQTIITGNAQGTTNFWDVSTGLMQGQPLHHRNVLLSLDVSSDGRIIVTGSGDHTARIWDGSSHQTVGNQLIHQGGVSGVALNSASTALATSCDKGLARIWDLVPAPIKLTHPTWVFAVGFSPDGKTVLTGCGDGSARLWDMSSGRLLSEPREHDGEVYCVAFRPDGRGFFTGSNSGQVWSWDLLPASNGAKVCRFPGRINAIAVSPSGRTLVSCSEKGMAILWDVVAGRARGTPMKHDVSVTSATFSPDGSTVLTGSRDGTARLWDAATGQPRGSAFVHPDEVVGVAFHPDGRRILTASRDTGVYLWDPKTGQPVGRPLPMLQAVTCMAIGHDGRTVLLGSEQGIAQLFDLDTAWPLSSAFAHERSIRAVALSPDGRTALTAGQDGAARIWDVPLPLEGTPERVRVWVQSITGLELKDDGNVSVLDAPTWRVRRQRLQALGGTPCPGL
ncbi:MAG: WD40 repeat domain-containing serine/threonine-protein kinase [Isosphaerales bacterium]